MSAGIVSFEDQNDGARYYVCSDIVKGFSVMETAATTAAGIALIGAKPEFRLQLWVEGRWWKLGTFESREDAEALGLHILGTDKASVSGQE